MKDAEENIERVLAGLRVAEPPAGIEGRILHAVEARNAVPSTADSTASRAWRTAAAVCTLVIAALWIVTITVRRNGTVSHQTARVATRQEASPETRPDTGPAQVPLTPRRVHAARRTAPAATKALSFPAPPLPLTDQEKLLLRLARQRDANKEAALNPAIHSAQMAKANEQFQQFFNIDDKEMRKQIE